jgi:hypothetical protein
MHRVKAFFYVSLGILALAVAFHFGAMSAHSAAATQGVLGAVGSTPSGNGTAAALDGQGMLWVWATGCGAPTGPLSLPKTGQILALSADANRCGEYWVLYADGDLYHNRDLVTNLFASGPIPTESTTWGRVKADRR